MHTVDPDSPSWPYQVFGDPRRFERFDRTALQHNDYAVLMKTTPGAIYFLRTRDGSEPQTAYQGRVTMTHLLLIPEHRGTEEKTLHALVGNDFSVEQKEGPEYDGVCQPFYLLKKKQLKER